MIAPAVTQSAGFPAALTNTQKIERALAQAGELGLTQPELAVCAGLEPKVVCWTLNNLRSAGRVMHSGEPYQHGRHWYLKHRARNARLEAWDADPLKRVDESNQEFERRMLAAHPGGYEDIRLRA